MVDQIESRHFETHNALQVFEEAASLQAHRWKFATANVDVSAITGANVAFAFRHKSNDSNGTTWEVDNIIVESGVTAINEVQALEFMIYPNPASSSIQLSKDAQRVEFISLSGQTLVIANDVSANTNLDVSSLAAGVYFVKVTTAGKTGEHL